MRVLTACSPLAVRRVDLFSFFYLHTLNEVKWLGSMFIIKRLISSFLTPKAEKLRGKNLFTYIPNSNFPSRVPVV